MFDSIYTLFVWYVHINIQSVEWNTETQDMDRTGVT